MRGCSAPVLAINYASLWNVINHVEEYLGYSVQLPPKRSRKSAWRDLSQKQQHALVNTYGPLRDKIYNTKPLQLVVGRGDLGF